MCTHASSGGRCRGPTAGCSEGYVWQQGSEVLAGLSGLLMTAIDWTSHTPSNCGLHTSSSSTTLDTWQPRPASPRLPPNQHRSDAFQGPLDNILALAVSHVWVWSRFYQSVLMTSWLRWWHRLDQSRGTSSVLDVNSQYLKNTNKFTKCWVPESMLLLALQSFSLF